MKVFLFKEINTDDRDCVKYIEVEKLTHKHTAIDGRYNLVGSCFSMSLKNDYDYNNLETILTEAEFLSLCEPNNDSDFTSIIEKLTSEENDKLFEKVILDEIEYIKNERHISEEDVNHIFENYGLEYRDRSIVSYIYKNTYDLGYEIINNFYTLDDSFKDYIDYHRYGKDSLTDDTYLELPSGKIAHLSY